MSLLGMNTDLFPDLPVSESPRLAWMRNHRVKTHHFTEDPNNLDTYNHCGFGTWLAYVGRMPRNEYDGNWAVGDSEDEALIRLTKANNWLLWNEEKGALRPLNYKGHKVFR